MKLFSSYKRHAIFVMAFFHIVGIVGLNIPATRTLFESLTPISLLTTTLIILLFNKKFDLGFFLFLGITMLVGFAVEVLGVHTKMIFGEYYYLSSLGPKIAGVPLMIAVNWFLLMYCCVAIASSVFKKAVPIAAIAALCMVCIDFVIEPFAIKHLLWTWPGGSIPLQNYLAWYVISFLLAFSTHSFIKRIKNEVAIAAYLIMLLFFVADKLAGKLF